MTSPIELDVIEYLYREITKSLGATEYQARIFCSCLSRADLRHDTQGMSMFTEYLYPILRRREARFDAQPKVAVDLPGLMVIDGDSGIGQIVTSWAMDLAIERSKRSGAACVFVRNQSDISMASNYAMQALSQDTIGIVFSSSGPARVAAWGGRESVFGTNPLAMAIPTADEQPIVIDMSPASYSIGTLVLAARAAAKSSGPSVVDALGQYLDDPRAVLPDWSRREPEIAGSILPIGPKGSALSLLVEILGGILPRSQSGQQGRVRSLGEAQDVGCLLIAIDLAAFGPVPAFKAAMDRFCRGVRNGPVALGFAEILLPGDRASLQEMERRANGVPVEPKTWDLMRTIAAECGVALPDGHA